MITQFKGIKGPISVAPLDNHMCATGKPLTNQLKSAIAAVLNGESNCSLAAKTAMRELITSTACISLETFTTKQRPCLHWELAQIVLAETALGRDLAATLGKCGLSAFLDRKSNSYRNTVNRLLAMFVLSTNGATGVSDLHEAALHIMFALRDEGRWREEYFRTPEVMMCLKQVFLAWERVFDDAQFRENSGNMRLSFGQNITWQALLSERGSLITSIRQLYFDYLESADGRQSKNGQMLMYVVSWLRSVAGDLPLEEIACGPAPSTSFSDYLKERAGGKATPNHKEYVRLAMHFSAYLIDNIEGPTEPRSLVTEKEYKAFTAEVERPKGSHRTGKIKEFPEHYMPYYLEILSEGEEGWPGQQETFRAVVNDGGNWVEKYCPVLVVFLYAVALLGSRGAQAKRLDSGEGDVERYNPSNNEWETNTGPNAGYWVRTFGPNSHENQQRNYACRYGKKTYVWLNTNKTGKPHPAEADRNLHLRLWEVRQYNEKFNLIDGPIDGREYVDGLSNYPLSTVRGMPAIFPLFRLPPSSRSRRTRVQPPSASLVQKAHCLVMAEVERRFNQQHPDRPIKLVRRNPTTNQLEKALYTLHGFRSHKATKKLREGVAFEVVSEKVLGHSSLTMTKVYDRRSPEEFDRLLNPRSMGERSKTQYDFMRQLGNLEENEALRQTATVFRDGLDIATSKDSYAGLINVELGTCPVGGTRCATGGPGGSDVGRRNCILCRYLISGSPWTRELYAYDITLTEQTSWLEDRLTSIQVEVNTAWNEREAGRMDRETYLTFSAAKNSAKGQIETELKRMRESKVNVSHLLEVCKSSLAKADGASLIVRDLAVLDEIKDGSDFRRTVFLSKFSRICTMIYDERREARLQNYLTALAFNNELRPCFTMWEFTDEERKRSLEFYLEVSSVFENTTLIENSVRGQATLNSSEPGRKVLSVLRASYVDEDLQMALASRQQTGRLSAQ